MFADMQDWTDIRRQVLVEGASKRSVCRQYGIAHKTLQKILAHPEPPTSTSISRSSYLAFLELPFLALSFLAVPFLAAAPFLPAPFFCAAITASICVDDTGSVSAITPLWVGGVRVPAEISVATRVGRAAPFIPETFPTQRVAGKSAPRRSGEVELAALFSQSDAVGRLQETIATGYP